MRALAILGVAALCVAAATASAVDTTDATFDEVVSKDFVLMEFYAPWCGHCKKLEPEWNKAAEQLKDVATIAKIDATKETESAGKYGIQGFPTIKIFREGQVAGDYNGGRTADDIVRFVKGNVGPAVKAIATADDLKTLKSENKVAVVLHLATAGGAKFEAFENVAKDLRGDFAFGLVTDAAIVDGAEEGTITVFKHFDEDKSVFSGDATSADEIKAFVKSEGVPLFDEIGPQNYKMYLDRGLPIVWVFAAPSDEDALAAGRQVAPEFKGKVSFVWIDSSKYAQMAQRLGLSGDKFPAVAIDNQGKHYAMDADVTADALSSFVKKYESGELQQTVRSEKAPEPHTVDGLTTVVGDTFKELVDEADTDVFIEFYAPWCGHCKQLAPTYEKVAKSLEDKPVRVAKFDATANDFPTDKFPVQGFPTMFYVPKAGEPQQYEGGRSEEAIASFINDKIGA